MDREQLPGIWENFGLCFGNHILNGGWQTINGIQEDVNDIVAMGIRYVRIPLRPFNNSTSAYAQQQQALLRATIQMFREADINVQLTIMYGSGWLPTNPDQEAFYEYLITNTMWAQSLGITRVSNGNEMESNAAAAATNSQIYTWLQTLPPMQRAAGYTGELHYNTFYDAMDQWRTYGLGGYNKIGAQHYGKDGSHEPYNRLVKQYFGDNAYLSEWNVNNNGDWWDFSKQDPIWLENQLTKWLSHIKELWPNNVHYLFTWKNANDGPFDALACRTLYSNMTRRFVYTLTGQRPPIVW